MAQTYRRQSAPDLIHVKPAAADLAGNIEVRRTRLDLCQCERAALAEDAMACEEFLA
jgi:hypothetical protein